jgi:hypothetical protein
VNDRGPKTKQHLIDLTPAADGLQVTLPARTWDHIHQRHPEVTVSGAVISQSWP